MPHGSPLCAAEAICGAESPVTTRAVKSRNVALLISHLPFTRLTNAMLRERGSDGVRDVTSGKILARKRPELIPIQDQVVERVVRLSSETGNYWEFFQGFLRNLDRRNAVTASQPEGRSIPTLRLLDAAIWMW